eukprot:358937-Chlamydomonas_euryale.AAC.15
MSASASLIRSRRLEALRRAFCSRCASEPALVIPKSRRTQSEPLERGSRLAVRRSTVSRRGVGLDIFFWGGGEQRGRGRHLCCSMMAKKTGWEPSHYRVAAGGGGGCSLLLGGGAAQAVTAAA